MEKKTHYRKVFKSDHLGSADLEEMIEDGKKLIFTIKEVKQEYGTTVAGRKIDANIAYFVEDIKPMVLNATNSKQVAKFAGSKFVEEMSNTVVELFIKSDVKLMNETVGGVRIRPVQPVVQKPDLTPEHKRWDEAKKAVDAGNLDGVLSRFNLSPTNLLLIQKK
jgi:hypothetical protein